MLGQPPAGTTVSIYHPVTGSASLVSCRMPSLLRLVLPGMIAAGLGLDILSRIFRIGSDALLGLAGDLGLPTPPALPLRKPGGRNPWSVDEASLLVVLWMLGWHAYTIAAALSRSPGGVWAKTRRMGLPRRERKAVFRPSDALVRRYALQSPGGLAGPGAVHPAPDPIRSPPAVPLPAPAILPSPVRGEVDLLGAVPVEPERARARRETEWTRALDVELAQRWWARQHYKAIARAMGMSPTAIQSRRFRLELPSHNDEADLLFLTRKALVDHFDPATAAANVKEADYVERKCNRFAPEVTFRFWGPRIGGTRTSREFLRGQKRRDARLAFFPMHRPAATACTVHA